MHRQEIRQGDDVRQGGHEDESEYLIAREHQHQQNMLRQLLKQQRKNLQTVPIMLSCFQCKTEASNQWHKTVHAPIFILCNDCVTCNTSSSGHDEIMQAESDNESEDAFESTLARHRALSLPIPKLKPVEHCNNCHTTQTSLWRKGPDGLVYCNACQLFEKLHKRPRPVSMVKNVIRKRVRTSTNFSSKAQTKLRLDLEAVLEQSLE